MITAATPPIVTLYGEALHEPWSNIIQQFLVLRIIVFLDWCMTFSLLLEVEIKWRLMLLSSLFIHGLTRIIIVIIEKSVSWMKLLLFLRLDLRIKRWVRARLTSREIEISKLQRFVRCYINIWAGESLFFATFWSWLKKRSRLHRFLRTLL